MEFVQVLGAFQFGPRKIFCRLRAKTVHSSHWHPGKLTCFNAGISTRTAADILVKMPQEMRQFSRTAPKRVVFVLQNFAQCGVSFLRRFCAAFREEKSGTGQGRTALTPPQHHNNVPQYSPRGLRAPQFAPPPKKKKCQRFARNFCRGIWRRGGIFAIAVV